MVEIRSSFIAMLAIVSKMFVVLIIPSCVETLLPDEGRPSWFRMEIPTDYNRQVPLLTDACPAIVEVGMYPRRIGRISVLHMNVEVDMLLILLWDDHRLNITPSNHTSEIVLNDEAHNLWLPSITLRNSMGRHTFTFRPNQDKLRLKYKDSHPKFYYVTSFVAKCYCYFQLAYYPMDTQICHVELQGINYKRSLLLIDISKNHSLMSKSTPPEFDIIKYGSGNCSATEGSSYFFSCVEYSFTLQRYFSYHIMLTYIPSGLIVVLSWISFWLEAEASPARVGLGLTSLLTLATQFSSVQKELPRVSYIKAIDVWMFTCIFMVFASLIEFAVVNYAHRRRKLSMVYPESRAILQVTSPHQKTYFANRKKESQHTETIDRAARILFPLGYVVFNLCYWGFYLTRNL